MANHEILDACIKGYRHEIVRAKRKFLINMIIVLLFSMGVVGFILYFSWLLLENERSTLVYLGCVALLLLYALAVIRIVRVDRHGLKAQIYKWNYAIRQAQHDQNRKEDVYKIQKAQIR